MRFQEGFWYFFTIENISNILEKGNHYVLKHESGRKMLLNAQHYVKYRFKVGQTIECRVDKVNCMGQIFLEPRHPFYNDGSFYSFKYLGIKNNEDRTMSLLVKDSFDNEIQVFINTHVELKAKKQVLLKIERIKKGIPILSIPMAHQHLNYVNACNNTIKLTVVAVVSENSEEYFSLADGCGTIISRLKVKHYRHYGLVTGKSYLFQTRGIDSNGLTLVEPENPWYKIGESYIFRIKNIDNYANLDGEEVKTVIVFDVNNSKCGVIIDVEQLKRIEKQTEVSCKVIGFKKGRPQLEIDLFNV
jgi:hypothetical protein